MFSTLTRGLSKFPLLKVTPNEPHFSTDQILAKVIKLNECLIKTKGTLGTPLFQNNTAMYVDPNLNFIKVNKVYPFNRYRKILMKNVRQDNTYERYI